MKNFLLLIATGLLFKLTAGAALTTNQAVYTVEEDIVAEFSDGPGNATDWVGIYNPGNIPDGDPGSITWAYTNGSQTAGGSATDGAVTFAAGSLSPGQYSLWFLANDGYSALAGPINITITNPEVAPGWVTSTIRRRHAVSGQDYTGKISAYASDPGFTFSKQAGPAWLTLSENGELSGTPTIAEVGPNSFTVRVSDGAENSDATLQIEVCAADSEIVTELKVMTYNAWHGWGEMSNGHRKGLESIILSDADIIGMQESLDNSSGSNIYQPEKVANDLGWHYRTGVSGSLGIISRYPITDQTLVAGSAIGAKIRVSESPKREIVIMNCHLDFREYGPYAAQLAGATEASVLVEERSSQRDEQITAIVAGMSSLLDNADEVPLFLTGDFNAPSQLDWVPATAADHNGIESVAWPTSGAVLGAGMRDSFREVHSKPEDNAGATWSPIFQGSEPQDRIDLVYFKGDALKPVASEVFTTEVETTLGSWGSDTTPARGNTWPSDHAAVVSIFQMRSVDRDDDGLCDAFEMRYFGNLTSQAGAGDPDGDGFSNRDEEIFASDPTDVASTPGIVFQFSTGANSVPKLSFRLSSQSLFRSLVCERSLDLRDWETIWRSGEVPATSSLGDGEWLVEFEDTGALDLPNADRLFYRLRSFNR